MLIYLKNFLYFSALIIPTMLGLVAIYVLLQGDSLSFFLNENWPSLACSSLVAALVVTSQKISKKGLESEKK